MNKYLVVSYDPDEQQWFYDIVLAKSSDFAKKKVLKVRAYCLDADTFTVEELGLSNSALINRTHREIKASWQDIRKNQ